MGRLLMYSEKKKHKKPKNGQEIYSLSELSVGDYDCAQRSRHRVFGGIRKIDTHGITKDYIKIDYAKGDVLYVPVISLIWWQNTLARVKFKVKLSRLGSQDWQKAKARVKTSVKILQRSLSLSTQHE